ncbi:MAG: HAD family hydrolase [Candidatus Phaeomarinobacter sp.]
MTNTARPDRPDLVIFDCDGVLVDSETIANELLAVAVTELGWPTTTADSHRRFRGRSWKSTIAIIENETGKSVPDEWVQRTRAQANEAICDTVTAIPGVADVIAQVEAAGIPRCVGSSSEPAYLAHVLGRTGLDHHFGDAVFSATMVANGKPAPDLFLFAASQMGHAPHRAVVIEDTLPGVQAGMAAGMRVVGYAGDPNTDRQALADAGATVVTDMAEVPTLLGLG